MYWYNSFHGFNFHDYTILNDKVQTVVCIDILTFVFDSKFNFTFIRNFSLSQLDRKTDLIG